ncbi:MAG: YtxH domain-containing protein [Elusimicrobia bacterium]|nr:YtxH domain-containing protein [Candidatus Liberimonas magnetica]
MSENNSGEVVLSFILGGLIGAAVGILFAPSAGKETRKKLKDMGEDFSEKMGHLSEELKDKAEHVILDGKDKVLTQKDRIEAAFEAGKKAYEKKSKVD